MTPFLAAKPDRHRAHHSKVVSAFLFVGVFGGVASCGAPRLPRPEWAQVKSADYVEVPFAPRPPPVEIVPAPPLGYAVWVDGTWDWSGQRYRWTPGAWVVPPAGAKHARWVVVRRPADGQLFFARSAWQDAAGKPIPEPPELVRARSRPTDD